MKCMMCGKDADLRETEEDRYCEFEPTGKKFWLAWVYCEPCDCWTFHPLEREL